MSLNDFVKTKRFYVLKFGTKILTSDKMSKCVPVQKEVNFCKRRVGRARKWAAVISVQKKT